MGEVTKCSPPYPKGYEPDFILPQEYCYYRFMLGKKGNNPFVAVCMNPSAARESSSDMTINRIINMSIKLSMDGWTVFNLYPERATDANTMENYDNELLTENISVMKKYLTENGVKEIFCAWGNDKGIKALIEGRKQMTEMLNEIGVKMFYFGTLTKDGNPRHPLQRQEKWDLSAKKYL